MTRKSSLLLSYQKKMEKKKKGIWLYFYTLIVSNRYFFVYLPASNATFFAKINRCPLNCLIQLPLLLTC